MVVREGGDGVALLTVAFLNEKITNTIYGFMVWRLLSVSEGDKSVGVLIYGTCEVYLSVL